MERITIKKLLKKNLRNNFYKSEEQNPAQVTGVLATLTILVKIHKFITISLYIQQKLEKHFDQPILEIKPAYQRLIQRSCQTMQVSNTKTINNNLQVDSPRNLTIDKENVKKKTKRKLY